MGLSSSTLKILQDNFFPYARIDMWNNQLLQFLQGLWLALWMTICSNTCDRKLGSRLSVYPCRCHTFGKSLVVLGSLVYGLALSRGARQMKVRPFH